MNMGRRWSVVLIVFLCQGLFAESRRDTAYQELQNGRVILKVAVGGPNVLHQTLSIDSAVVESDGDFGLDVMYTDWQAPGKANNAENPVLFTKADFVPVSSTVRDLPSGSKELTIFMKARETTFIVALTYLLDEKATYIKRKIAVEDTTFGHHFLRSLIPVRSLLAGVTTVIKDGGFGQPVAVLLKSGGGFFGLEYPASENHLTGEGKEYRVSCSEDIGKLIGRKWVESEWVVEGISPDALVRQSFFKYLDDIRIAPLRPYTLYNSWYDLRSPEYPHVPAEDVMSETSARRMMTLLRENMIEKHGMTLDAFVLDDGWDVYKSDWVPRKDQFPNGLKVLADELHQTHTSLGIWIGPTGGYSFRDRRIGWMKEHGYEIVGDQLCIGGAKYHELLKTRVGDFAGKDGIGYFKWDGIQFSCSEPNHGHPIDIYSRRAILDSLIDLCRVARAENPSMFLNITSGTWLSPWWVKYANTIWMSGEDYGYADVPSISKRDAAITYRDFVLHDDFKTKDLWFPIANLMTHGIIKGRLEYLGSKEEPLDKFTDDALLYVARGISMYELYISPDILSEGEWNALAKSITWARDRFPVLMSTTMIGGDPMKRQPYGYVHFKRTHGVIAVRNPFIDRATIDVSLSRSFGIEQGAQSLVLERVYPTRWIAPRLYREGANITIPVDGFETAVYEVYPLKEATVPLVAGVTFEEPSVSGSHIAMQYHPAEGAGLLLNPQVVRSARENGSIKDPKSLRLSGRSAVPMVTEASVSKIVAGRNAMDATFRLSDSASGAKLAILLSPHDGTRIHPVVRVAVDGDSARVDTVEQDSPSQWYLVDVRPGMRHVRISIEPRKGGWKGSASLWIVGMQRLASRTISFDLTAPVAQKPMPPLPWSKGEERVSIHLRTVDLALKDQQ